MELEELQKAWRELNDRVKQNELVHQQQIIEMLSRQKESSLQKMIRLDRAGFALLFSGLMYLGYAFTFIRINWLVVFCAFVLTAATVCAAVGLYWLEKIKNESDLEEQIRRTLRYRLFVNWVYLGSYLSVVPILGGFFYYCDSRWIILLTCGLFVASVLVDYFQYHFLSDKLKELGRINRELAELGEHPE